VNQVTCSLELNRGKEFRTIKSMYTEAAVSLRPLRMMPCPLSALITHTEIHKVVGEIITSRSTKENSSVTCLSQPPATNKTLRLPQLLAREQFLRFVVPPHSAWAARFRADGLITDATHHKQAERRDDASGHCACAAFLVLQYLDFFTVITSGLSFCSA
jgi:hypothetical protein